MTSGNASDLCAVEGCAKLVGQNGVRGWCKAHYARWQRYGSPTASKPRARPTVEQQFWPKVDKRGPNECWPWTGHTKRNGYGAINVRGRVEMAHRIAYMLNLGPIPDGKVVDHVCRNRACMNPAHLQAVTMAENAHNRGACRGSTSGVRGVGWNGAYGKWMVQVTAYGQHYFGGNYDTVEEAERVAIALRNELMTNNLPDREVS